MKIILSLIVLILILIYIIPSQSEMQFTYQIVGKGATATTYSYLKEPRIQETGYTRGLKSGSFNYLENGDMTINEVINYYYGNGTNKTNSSVDHTLKVDFSGQRGISEFGSQGFFGNNRWISAWKKIRYEESPSMKVDGWSMVNRPSSNINVDASVHMDTMKKMLYDFLTRGHTLNITNNLYDYERIVPAAGPNEDWLPCCYSGTVPKIEQLDVPWPSDVMIATLQANTNKSNMKLRPNLFDPTKIGLVNSASMNNYLTKGTQKIGMLVSVSGSQYMPAKTGQVKIVSMSSYPIKGNLKIGMIASIPEIPSAISINSPSGSDSNIQIITEPSTCKGGSCPGESCIETFDGEPFTTEAGDKPM
ncbi:MAG: hypothetical protein NTZ38_02735, partial [Candidatus Taylorbacteria bacterium]|nr:hypothetical protein [Candidatus Taylorbacteria bacterium]